MSRLGLNQRTLTTESSRKIPIYYDSASFVQVQILCPAKKQNGIYIIELKKLVLTPGSTYLLSGSFFTQQALKL